MFSWTLSAPCGQWAVLLFSHRSRRVQALRLFFSVEFSEAIVKTDLLSKKDATTLIWIYCCFWGLTISQSWNTIKLFALSLIDILQEKKKSKDKKHNMIFFIIILFQYFPYSLSYLKILKILRESHQLNPQKLLELETSGPIDRTQVYLGPIKPIV